MFGSLRFPVSPSAPSAANITFRTEFAETAAQNLGCTVAITDTDMFIASSGKEKRLFANSKIDEELDYQIQTKEKYESPSKIIVPILAHGDVIGSIIMIANEDKKLSDVETKTAQIGAEFIATQLYS